MEFIAVLPGLDLPDLRHWQTALATVGLPWRFEGSSNPAAASGFYPMRAGKIVSGAEISDNTTTGLPEQPSPGNPHRIIAFRWGGDELEYACALTAAAALVQAGGANVYDPSEELARINPLRLNGMAAEITAKARGKIVKRRQFRKSFARSPRCPR